MEIIISDRRDLKIEDILALYQANEWSAAGKPSELHQGLLNSHSLYTAWEGDKLVGLGNAISDGYLVVYYPHFLVHPEYQGKGIGLRLLEKMQEKYGHFHMQVLTADGDTVEFYKKIGFKRAGETKSMWIYDGDEH
ncbi:GNAT family N-acetyltransferase [Salmonirosea aquatica]|uniref:GNAT family N-acetyltransferase n=1 Tax=Salmonirosea aquatica TaxID=2654236 RepID=A0A7C9FBI9_9BACT|nr:GNAT family N-acetyltransferase [Cytophagaceae bacterium SJW1-29]